MAASIVAERRELPIMLTARDLQEVLGISRPKAYELMARDDFPAVRLGAVWRVSRDGLFRWLETQYGRKHEAGTGESDHE
jgi:excisionase family DNA binding protein